MRKMKMKYVVMLVALTVSIFAEPVVDARIHNRTVFDIYNLGALIPKQVNQVGLVVGFDRDSGRSQLWRWGRSLSTGRVTTRIESYPRTPIQNGEEIYLSQETPSIAIHPYDTNGYFEEHYPSGIAGSVNVPGQGIRGYWVPIISSGEEPVTFIPTLDNGDFSVEAFCPVNSSLIGTVHLPTGEAVAVQYDTFTRRVEEVHNEDIDYTLADRFPDLISSASKDCDSYDMTGWYSRRNARGNRSFSLMKYQQYRGSDYHYLFADLGDLGGDQVWSRSITYIPNLALRRNDYAVVVGSALNTQGIERAFLVDRYEDRVVGSGKSGYLERKGLMQDLGTLTGRPDASSGAYGINEDKVIVGWSRDISETYTTAFVRLTTGEMKDLNELLRDRNDAEKWQLLEARAISKRGDYIVGVGLYQEMVDVHLGLGTFRYPVGTPQYNGFLLVPSADPLEFETLPADFNTYIFN